jgi:hypothetical protein
MRKRDALRCSSPEEYERIAADLAFKDEAKAMREWHDMLLGSHALCARGCVWRVVAVGPKRWAQVFRDGSLDRVCTRPWWPLICARLPVWPIAVEAPRIVLTPKEASA